MKQYIVWAYVPVRERCPFFLLHYGCFLTTKANTPHLKAPSPVKIPLNKLRFHFFPLLIQKIYARNHIIYGMIKYIFKHKPHVCWECCCQIHSHFVLCCRLLLILWRNSPGVRCWQEGIKEKLVFFVLID